MPVEFSLWSLCEESKNDSNALARGRVGEDALQRLVTAKRGRDSRANSPSGSRQPGPIKGRTDRGSLYDHAQPPPNAVIASPRPSEERARARYKSEFQSLARYTSEFRRRNRVERRLARDSTLWPFFVDIRRLNFFSSFLPFFFSFLSSHDEALEMSQSQKDAAFSQGLTRLSGFRCKRGQASPWKKPDGIGMES